jgi:glycerophosphoryl diester phosphodiesterase
MKRPLVLAHRGACWDAPENTLEAFELAVEQGADYVEFDVVGGADGELVVCHDPPPPPGVPTLDETLAALVGRVGLAVEIKDAAATEGVLGALARHDVDPERLLVLSFRPRALERVRRARPDVRCVLHLGRRPDPLAALSYWGVGFEDPVGVSKIRLAQAHGLATTVFTVNEPARMRELATLGVDGIFTDRPALLRETLAALPARERARSRRETTR